MNISNLIPKQLQGKVGTGVEALLGLIPYAGGTLATVLGNYLADKKLEKIADALDSLAKKVDVNDVVINKLLTEGQVCELLEKHLIEVAVSSDENKIKFLKNSLNNSFTRSDLEFQEKEFYLTTLKNLTTAEIMILKKIYLGADPFVATSYPQKSDNIDSLNGVNLTGIDNNLHGGVMKLPHQFVVESTYYVEGNQTLESYFEKEFDKKWHLIKGGCLQLDSKGLTNIQSNLDNKTQKKIKMNYPLGSNGIYIKNPSFYGGGGHLVIPSKLSKTAYEGSKTDFGTSFMEYVTA